MIPEIGVRGSVVRLDRQREFGARDRIIDLLELEQAGARDC